MEGVPRRPGWSREASGSSVLADRSYWATTANAVLCFSVATATRAEVSDLSWRTKIRTSLVWQNKRRNILRPYKKTASLFLQFLMSFLQSAKKLQCQTRGYPFNHCRCFCIRLNKLCRRIK